MPPPIKISIITIAYNSAATIAETIESVLSQAYENLEYIIIDGASTDGTQSIVERYRQHLSYFVSEPDRGISHAFNKGIEQATGQIIGILNADDVMLPNTLQRLNEAYEPGIDVYRANLLIWNDQTNLTLREVPTLRFSRIPIWGHVCHQGVFVTPEAYARWGGYKEECRYAMDLDLLLRFQRNGARMKHCDFEVAKFRIGGVTSHDFGRKSEEYRQLLPRNGGTASEAFLFYWGLWLQDRVKRLLDHFGPDLKRIIRHGWRNYWPFHHHQP
ncbi:MAG: glycosyltransferase family 2 protein [Bacteroidales bacterium]|nr:glycosyltransferase family 2 protein [Bacteroidales bacterium]